jgi:hypothetical protein
MKKPTHGGKRKGAGRTPGSFVKAVKKEPTVVMRVPLSLVEDVKKMIQRLRNDPKS